MIIRMGKKEKNVKKSLLFFQREGMSLKVASVKGKIS
jgi:hypothetical protein